MNTSWFKHPLTIPLLLIIIGVAIFLYQSGFFSGPLVLEEKTAVIDGETVSILAPKNSEELPEDNPSVVVFGKRKADILLVSAGLSGPTRFSGLIKCSTVGLNTVFTSHLSSLAQDVEICEEPINLVQNPEYRGYKQLGTSMLIYEGRAYLISVIVKEKYLNTDEGMEKVKQIFESFTVG